MILGQETAQKVSALFKTPHTAVIYAGVHYKNTVCFSIENADENGLTVSGFVAHITEDFKVYKVERMRQIWRGHTGKGKEVKTVTEYLPIHPAGNKTLLYKLMIAELSNGKKVTCK